MKFRAKEGVEKPLSPEPSQRVVTHSDKFEWGYHGKSGSTQLALALLLEVAQNPDFVLTCYYDFERSVIGGFSKHSWELTAEEIRQWIGEWKVASDRYGIPYSNTDSCHIFSRSAIYPRKGNEYHMSYSQSLGELISQVRNALINLELGFIVRNQEECKRIAQLVVKECKEIEKVVDECFDNNIQ